MATEFNAQTGGGKYRIQFETDNAEYFMLMQELARRCVDHHPIKTNADAIRAMSDEYLANYLMQFTDLDCRIGFCQNLPKCEALLDTEDGIPLSLCEKCLLQWIQQPAEDDC